MNWNIINARKAIEQEEAGKGTLDISKYKLKKNKRINPSFEQRKEIARIVGKPVLQICRHTKGWTEMELKGCIMDSINDSKKFKIPAGARCWNIIKEINKKRNENNKIDTR